MKIECDCGGQVDKDGQCKRCGEYVEQHEEPKRKRKERQDPL